ncbi:hypothetical protein GCM10020260_00440 [Nesterenkonia halobia]|uniref:Integrase catalytic domain-containing protein n=1 Tax=Nesterenkonia halobia TaxID=37922 RepID=A0ABP6R5N2_9MICC
MTVTCRVLGFSKQAFYKWNAATVAARDLEEAHLLNAAYDVHADDPEFGHRFIADEVTAAGYLVSERRVWRLSSQERIFSSTQRRSRSTTKKAGPAVTDDLVHREFTAEAPNRLWLTDITEHRTAEGTLYLCAVKDVFSNRIVGYALDRRMKSALAVAAIEDAVTRRGRNAVIGCVVHSDRGSQFRSRKYQRTLAAHRLAGSMGRVGAAGDNAAMESFFSTLVKNVLNTRSWDSRDQLRRRIIHWIERTYHRRRRQRRLGKLTPIEYETVYTQDVALAA